MTSPRRASRGDSGSAVAVALVMVTITGLFTSALVERAHLTVHDIERRLSRLERRDLRAGALRAAIVLAECSPSVWVMEEASATGTIAVSCHSTPEAEGGAVLETYSASIDGDTPLTARVWRDDTGRVTAWQYMST